MEQIELTRKQYYCTQLEVIQKKVRIAEDDNKYFSKIIQSPDDLYRTFKFIFENQPVEIFVAFHLKSNNGIAAFEIITKGILNSSLIHPREVFRSAIIRNAASVIIAHNHPSGNPEPSSEDLQITRQIIEAGKIIGIPVHDHIIFTENSFCSFAERGLM